MTTSSDEVSVRTIVRRVVIGLVISVATWILADTLRNRIPIDSGGLVFYLRVTLRGLEGAGMGFTLLFGLLCVVFGLHALLSRLGLH